jgi:hypothetical protein
LINDFKQLILKVKKCDVRRFTSSGSKKMGMKSWQVQRPLPRKRSKVFRKAKQLILKEKLEKWQRCHAMEFLQMEQREAQWKNS